MAVAEGGSLVAYADPSDPFCAVIIDSTTLREKLRIKIDHTQIVSSTVNGIHHLQFSSDLHVGLLQFTH